MESLFANELGNLLVEVSPKVLESLDLEYVVVGEVTMTFRVSV